jgi:hypothetical protein
LLKKRGEKFCLVEGKPKEGFEVEEGLLGVGPLAVLFFRAATVVGGCLTVGAGWVLVLLQPSPEYRVETIEWERRGLAE